MKNEIEYLSNDGLDLQKISPEDAKRYKELSDKPLKELIALFDDSVDKKDGSILSNDYYLVRSTIKDIFGFPTADEVNIALKSVKTLIEDLDAKLRNHRHDTTKQFSAKPEF